MNYYAARQRADTLRWDYTRRNDNHIHAIGYCRGWEEPDEEALVAQFGEHTGKMISQAREDARPYKDRYHTGGHETKEEACECYKRYLLDQRVRLDAGETKDTQHRCEVDGCEAWTQKQASVDHRTFLLCDDHRNMETLEKLFNVGEMWSSY